MDVVQQRIEVIARDIRVQEADISRSLKNSAHWLHEIFEIWEDCIDSRPSNELSYDATALISLIEQIALFARKSIVKDCVIRFQESNLQELDQILDILRRRNDSDIYCFD